MLHLLPVVTLFIALAAGAAPLPRPDHVVIVIEENKPYSNIAGNTEAPYINDLARRGVLFTQSYGVAHPSQPNYLALFSGSTHGVADNRCPLELSGANLASALIESGLSFMSYAESLPQPGHTGCGAGAYYRKHNPVANWPVLAAYNRSFAEFPRDYTRLPTVALVIPDQRHDMHDGSIAQGDAWLRQQLNGYVRWAMQHNSLLIVTWDEDDSRENNRVATILVGPMVQPGTSGQRIDHYSLLRTLTDLYRLPHIGRGAAAMPIDGIWLNPPASKKKEKKP